MSSLRPVTRVHLAMALYIAVFSFLCIQRATTAMYGDPDLGLFHQSFWTTLHKGWLLYNTYESGTHFCNHNSPVFLLIFPFYAAVPCLETLLVVQTVAIALGALAVFRLTSRLVDESCAVLLAWAYLLYHPLHGVNYDQINELAFLPAPLLFAFDALYQRRMGRFWVCALLALSCKEDVPFVTFMMGVYMMWLGRREERRTTLRDPLVQHGLLLSLVSVAWLLLSLQVLFPWLRGGASWPYFKERYGHIGGSFHEVATNLLTRPWIALPYVLGSRALLIFAELTLPLTFLPLRAPSILLIAAPTWAILQLSSFGAMHNCGSRYMAPVIVCVFVSAIVGLRGASPLRALDAPLPPFDPARTSAAHRRCRWVLGLTILSTLLFDTTPLRFPFRNVPRLTEHQRARNALADRLPPQASVSTQPEFYARVSNRVDAWIGYHPGTEYVLVDPTPDRSGKATWFDHAKWDINLPLLISRGEYEVIDQADGALLLRRIPATAAPAR